MIRHTLGIGLGFVCLFLSSLASPSLSRAASAATAGPISCWSDLATGANDAVLALAVDGDGNLYAGGDFTTIDGVTVNFVARWDGTAWTALGTGMDASVRALAVDAFGDLYAGGSFSTAGGVTAYRVAKWSVDTGTWSALGAGNMFGVQPVGTMVVDGANLYVGGSFNQPQGAFTNGVARWNGSTWSAVGTGINGQVHSLAFGAGTLYAGGNFGVPGGNYIAMFDGSSWSAVGSGMNGPVYAIALDDGNVYAGGAFTIAGSNAAARVASFDGTSWSALGPGMDINVHDLVADAAGNIYACGEFTSPSARIARWNGSGWGGLGSGLDDYALAVARDGATLYTAGAFTTAGAATALRVASWSGNLQYADLDGDGHGDAAVVIEDCSLIPGYVLNDDDCDDTNASVYPVATEVCDGLDNNCNGQVDEAREGTAEGLVAWWKADNSSVDYADGHDGTIVGNVPYVPGQIGEAFSFDGASGYVSVPHHAALDITGAITLEAWVNTTAGFNQYIITKNEDSFYLAIGPVGSSPNKASFWLNGVTGSWLQSTTDINDGDWHHLAATYDGAQIRIYVDGSVSNSAAATGAISTGTNAVLLGNRLSEGISTGKFDEIAVSNRALSAAEILAIYQNGRCAPLVDVPERSVRNFDFGAPWPNPTSRGVNLEFVLPSAARVRADVVDIAGRRVSPVLVDRELPPGGHRLEWNGLDPSGRKVAPGIYLIRIRAGDALKVRRIIAIR